MTTVEDISLSSFYESIIENAESNILILDQEFSIVSVNPRFFWIFLEAFDVQLKKGERLFNLMHPVAPLVADRWRLRCQAALKGLSISDDEDFESHGQSFSWKMYYKSLKVGSNQFVSIYCRNISGAKIFQNKILQHEANLRTMLNSFNASIWLLNDKFELIDFNDDTFAHFMNTYNVALRPAKNFIELIPENISGLRQRWLDRLNAALLTSQTTSHVDHMNINGNPVICETKMIPVISEDRVVGMTLVMEDITQKRADEQLQNVQLRELLKLSSELDKFVANASHDLRAPLLSIIGVLNVMKRKAPEELALFNSIESTLKKLDNFVTNIINYSHENKLEVKTEEIDFETTITSVIETLTYLDSSTSIKCVSTINQNTPFFSDRVRVLTILRNTLASAFQAFDKTKTTTIEISVHVSTAYASIELIDRGFDEIQESYQSVFERFFRESETSTGSGLSLFIVKSTIEKLEGTITITADTDTAHAVMIRLPNMIVSK